ncbi:MAG: diacylglycerol kinase family protein [Bacteroidota bacterium]|jgi:diacylglycerol kinase (ATP)
MKSDRPFSIQARLKSFVYAFEGVMFFIRFEAQATIHLIAIVAVLGAGYWFKISSMEWIAVVFAIGIVISAEMLNTAIEKLTDMVSPQINEQAKIVKDLAAGAVLIASLTAFIIGLIVFLPKIL